MTFLVPVVLINLSSNEYLNIFIWNIWFLGLMNTVSVQNINFVLPNPHFYLRTYTQLGCEKICVYLVLCRYRWNSIYSVEFILEEGNAISSVPPQLIPLETTWLVYHSWFNNLTLISVPKSNIHWVISLKVFFCFQWDLEILLLILVWTISMPSKWICCPHDSLLINFWNKNTLDIRVSSIRIWLTNFDFGRKCALHFWDLGCWFYQQFNLSDVFCSAPHDGTVLNTFLAEAS